MSPLFLANHPALDFLNTTFAPQGEPIELIGDGASLLEWLGAAALLDKSEIAMAKRRFGAKSLNRVATEARTVREWARDWLDHWRVDPRDGYAAQIRFLNDLLAHDKRRREVIRLQDHLSIREHAWLEIPDALIGLIAAQIAALVTTEVPMLVKRCAGEGCTLWFLDRTKAHRRLFCSAAVCGNRAKVAAYRSRQGVRS